MCTLAASGARVDRRLLQIRASIKRWEMMHCSLRLIHAFYHDATRLADHTNSQSFGLRSSVHGTSSINIVLDTELIHPQAADVARVRQAFGITICRRRAATRSLFLTTLLVQRLVLRPEAPSDAGPFGLKAPPGGVPFTELSRHEHGHATQVQCEKTQ